MTWLEHLAGPLGYPLLAGIGAGWLIVKVIKAFGWAMSKSDTAYPMPWVMRKDRAGASERPAWMGRLGHALAAQFYEVDQTHRFTGDCVKVIVEQTYSGGGKSFLVSVQRKEPQNDEG